MSIQLLDILSPQCIKVPLESTEKRASIDELVDVLAESGKVTDPASLKAAVWARESTRTTGMGHAVAFPHSKCDSVSSLCMAIGKPAEPMDFQSIDDQPVKLIVLLASPTDRRSDHILALAQISRLMASDRFRHEIFAADSADEVYALLQSKTPANT